jgi:hypothetical protein
MFSVGGSHFKRLIVLNWLCFILACADLMKVLGSVGVADA